MCGVPDRSGMKGQDRSSQSHIVVIPVGIVVMGTIVRESVEGVEVIRLAGQIESELDKSTLYETAKDAFAASTVGILLDYEEVTYITSGNYGIFMGTAISIYRQGQKCEKLVKFYLPKTPELEHLYSHLEITHIDRLLTFYSNRAEALSSFRSSS